MNSAASNVISLGTIAVEQSFIDRAARTSGVSRGKFILIVAYEKALELLADQTGLVLGGQTLRGFNSLRDAPLANNTASGRLLAKPSAWE